MNAKIRGATLALLSLAAWSCADREDRMPTPVIDPVTPADSTEKVAYIDHVFMLDEGNWQSDNGQVTCFRNGQVTNNYFAAVNGFKVGDTPQDIVYLPEQQMLLVVVNWSNILYWCDTTLLVKAQTENVPNCRSACSDGTYAYVTSYAHQTALGETYTKGYVAKVDIATHEVVATCEVGYEPEGIAYYDGRLYVANSGGYAFAESHDYEHTVSVVDPATMTELRQVEILDSDGNAVINLYGEVSQSGKYLCINSPGDYYSTPAASVIFDCEAETYKVFTGTPCTYNTTLLSGKFFVTGSTFSYETGLYKFNAGTIDPVRGEYADSVYECPDGTLSRVPFERISQMSNPYCVYQNPYTGTLFMVDANDYASAGYVWTFSADGRMAGPYSTYINTGHMVAIPTRADDDEE